MDITPVKFKAEEFEEKGYNPNSIIIPALDANKKFNKLLVETTRKELEIILNELNKRTREQLTEYFKDSYNKILSVSQETLIETPRTEPIWIQWKDHLLVFYICRFLLLQKEVPIVIFDKLQNYEL